VTYFGKTEQLNPKTMGRKRKELTADDLYNGWLTPYHGITIQWLVENETELIKTPEWYKKYSVSQSQHDEWYAWAINELATYRKCSKKRAKEDFCFDYLNISPSVKNE
jgi:hypothetical protein